MADDRVELELLAVNAGVAKRVMYEGREYFEAPLTTIVPGVLNGSQGALHYELNEIAKAAPTWNGVPIVVYHPTHAGRNVSAKHPGVLEKSGIGFLRDTTCNGKLQHLGMFDVERTKIVDQRVYDALDQGKPMELSTGLFTDNVKEGDKLFARNHRPDHLAILPDQRGACSIEDGCGVLVNSEGFWSKLKGLIANMLGRGNHGYGKLKSEAEALSAAANDPASHKAAGDAHMEASMEAAKPTATGGASDYNASGAHKVKAEAHYKAATDLSNNWRATMTAEERKATVAFLTTNCKCEEAALNKLSDERLEKLKASHDAHLKELVANASAMDDDEEEEDSDIEEENVKRRKGKPTANVGLSDDDKEALAIAHELAANEKDRLVERLVANVKDKDARKAKVDKLRGKSIAQLREFVELLPVQNVERPSPLYLGAAGAAPLTPVANFNPNEDLLDVPTINFALDDETGGDK